MSEVVTWWPARRRLATLALAVAFVTGVMVAVVGGGGAHVARAGFHVVITIGALRVAALVTGQVVVGLLMIASVLLGTGLAGGLLLAPAVAGVIVTAELLAAVARLDSPIERNPGPVVARALASGALGGVVYASVLVASGTFALGPVPGLITASGAALLLGVLLLSAARSR